jgi:aminopeptidase N
MRIGNMIHLSSIYQLNCRCPGKLFFQTILPFLLIINSVVYGQVSSGTGYKPEIFFEKQQNENGIQEYFLAGTEASAWFDVVYYRLDLDIIAQSNYLKGKVTIAGICRKDSTRSLTLDLVNKMQIDSVIVDGRKSSFFQNTNSFYITLVRSYTILETISIDVYYGGMPSTTGFGSFVFDSHSGVPWIYTLSEPYGAKDWWPCKDDPGDKADSADIIVKCDSNLKAGSEGILASVTQNGDGTYTYFWKERYPIASYLISLAITNYAQFSNWFHYSDKDSMEVLNYILPEHYDEALQSLPRVTGMLAIFSELFGTYPFIKEKYGHAEFGRGGAMEHQTMTSTSTFDENTIAHELAHQWFGDMITCRYWSELWLNEGFAQYATALYLERRYGIEAYWDYMNTQIENAETAKGELGNPDTTNVRNLFDLKLVYSKGASVLHMLRNVLGDSVFFLSIRQYADNPVLQYAAATTQDFQFVCEQVSGKNLDYFFQEWVYGKGYPVYIYSWIWESFGNSSKVILDIGQNYGRSNPEFFTMPIDIRIISAGRDTTITVMNNALQQRFTINFDERPDTIILDPERWIMKFVLSGNEQHLPEYALEQNYPNPFNSETNIIYRLQHLTNVTLKIYDILGREIETLVNARQTPGVYEYRWISNTCASGIYFYRLTAGNFTKQKKMVLIK